MADREMTPDQFTSLKGGFKQWASLGVIGVLAGLTCYLVMWQSPAMHTAHLKVITDMQTITAAEIKAERDAARADAEKSRAHGNDAAKVMGESIKSLNDTFIRVQERTQENQKTLIDLQIKKMEQDKVK